MQGEDLIKAAADLLGEEYAPPVEERLAIPNELQVEAPVVESSGPSVDGGLGSSLVVVDSTIEHSSQLMVREDIGQAVPYVPPPPPTNATQLQKFGDLPTQIREQETINLVEIKKLNLAAALEALERATQSHESYPSPDAGFAVASLSEQILKLTRDLEKSQDPRVLLDNLIEDVLGPLTHNIVQDLAAEMKRLRDQTLQMVREDKKDAFDVAFKTAVNRMGPSMKERLEVAKNRVARVLSVKEKPGDKF